MLKLMFMVVTFLMLGMALFGLRQHRWELRAEAYRLDRQITEREQSLWGQESQISVSTDPRKLVEEIKASGIELALPVSGSATQPARSDATGDLVGAVRRTPTRTTVHH